MKTLIQYIKESLINEGGKAVNGTPMTQPQVKAVYQDVIKKILEPKLGLTEEGVDYAPLGTFGKKKEDQTSGDLDIAISIERIAGYLGISVDMVGQAVQDILAETGVDFVFNPGTLVTSFAWPIPGTDKFGQVDFMPSDNMDYSKWMYHSPDFTTSSSNSSSLLYSCLSSMSFTKSFNFTPLILFPISKTSYSKLSISN